MKILVNNKEIILNDSNWLTGGGEGSIYEMPANPKNHVIKIFNKAEKATPISKIKELKMLDKDNILRPLLPVYNKNKKPIGFVMKEAPQHYALCQLYTSKFWAKNNIKINNILLLLNNIRSTIEFIHSKDCLLVDINDFNFLVDQNKLDKSYFIDVDSYETPNYPATAIADNIRDWHATKWDRNTDWFSFSILACQLLVGIHPFKGTHPSFSKGDLKNRMLANKSIFNNDVRLPSATRNFNIIPDTYKQWFLQLFEHGKRIPPPHPCKTIVFETTDSKIEYENYFLINNKKYPKLFPNEKLIFIEQNIPIAVGVNNNVLKARVLDSKFIINSLSLSARAIIIIDNCVLAITKDKIIEICLTKLGFKNIVISCGNFQSNILRYAQIFDKTIYQNILGNPHFTFFEKKNSKLQQYCIPINELKGYKIVDAVFKYLRLKHVSPILIVKAFKDGIYDKFTFTFTKDNFSIYDVFCNENIDINEE
jgi:hypothetical protein